MRFSDLLRIGGVNLWRRKTRTILTALSMTIGVMCIIVLISIGIGYEQAFQESVESMGSLTKIDVMLSTTPREQIALLNDNAVEAFKGLDGVEAVTPVVQGTAYLQSGKYINQVRMYGIDLATADSFQLTPLEGISPTEGVRMRPEVMLTDDVGAGFADPAEDWEPAVDEQGQPLIDPMYSTIRLSMDYNAVMGEQQEGEDGRALPTGATYPLNVSGICSSQNNTFSSSVFLDTTRLEEWLEEEELQTTSGRDWSEQDPMERAVVTEQVDTEETTSAVAEALAGQETYELVWVKAEDVEDVERITAAIEGAGFETYSLNDMLDTVKTQSRQIQALLGAIGVVAMIVSAFGVANTMTMSITERTREIGILKVLGSELTDIAKMFLTEAAIVGVLGGVLGLGLSYIVQLLLPTILAGTDLRSVIPFWLAVGGVLFAGVVALAAAIIPASNAMRISPNEAIRTE